MTTVPFDPPKLLTARRHVGFVDIPDEAIEQSLDFMPPSMGSPRIAREPIIPGPTALKRSQTMSGSIIVVEGSDRPNQAYWLARKVEQNFHGVTRIGYKLRPNSKEEFKNAHGAWELDIDESCEHPLVTVKMINTKILDDTKSGEKNMMSFLQMIGNKREQHVDGTSVVATCGDVVYLVLPYHRDGSLEAYCRLNGTLPESLARFFFRQILQGMQTLQTHELCHRDLSLNAVALDENHVSITESRFPLRVKRRNANADDDQPPPTPAASSVQYIAPEYFRGHLGPWNGFAADMWSCGLMLYSMVVGPDALFLAPIDDDRTFVKLCLKGQINSLASKYGDLIGKTINLSDELVDLLRQMVQADPQKRLSLEQVLEHPWVTSDDLLAPMEWAPPRLWNDETKEECD